MSKATVAAPANIAFIKYWGARDLERALPMNPSISMTLDALRHPAAPSSPSTAGERRGLARASRTAASARPSPEFAERSRTQLDRVRAVGRAARSASGWPRATASRAPPGSPRRPRASRP